MSPTYLTTAQVAERWACDRSTVTARARSGELLGMRLGTDWRFSVAAVEAFEREHTTGRVEAPSHEAPKAEPIRPVLAPLDEGRVLGERWWERETTGAVSSAAGRGRSTDTEKAASAATRSRP